MTPPFRQVADGVTLYLRVTPNAGVDRIAGVETRDDGSVVLRVKVRAVPDKGKANAAVIALIAEALGIPRSTVTLVNGDTARLKTLHIPGSPDRLAALLAKLS